MMNEHKSSPENSLASDGLALEGELVSEASGAPPELVREEKVWRQWLESMASDSESALAAAMAYREMSNDQRSAMLTSLLDTGGDLKVPLFAIIAPLLAVEDDPERRGYLEAALVAAEGNETASIPQSNPLALWNVSDHWRTAHDSGDRLLVFILPLYLNFVQVLAVEITKGALGQVRHDPILDRNEAPQSGQTLDGLKLEAVPLNSAVDLLAQCIVVTTRRQLPIPEALRVMADWLNPVSDTPAPPLQSLDSLPGNED